MTLKSTCTSVLDVLRGLKEIATPQNGERTEIRVNNKLVERMQNTSRVSLQREG